MGVDGSQRIGAALTPRFGVASTSGVNPALERRLVQRRRNWKPIERYMALLLVTLTSQPNDQATIQPSNLLARQPASQPTDKPNDQTTNQQTSQTTWSPAVKSGAGTWNHT
ncbi:unnamed protein product [Pleuronectes platessa]|uniref:Uncharacterized protein n=1 Tax=Pleuronectes platessa TaxID=8262 RepID=A0A9N7TVK9_PLEPL|nr:unnamed protein product [Pleuronectes platessa]